MCSENIEDDGSFYLEGPITRPKMGLEIWYAKIDRERPEFAGIRDRLRGVLDADEFDKDYAERIVRVWNNAEKSRGKIADGDPTSEIELIECKHGDIRVRVHAGLGLSLMLGGHNFSPFNSIT